jgi:FtsP/CotA-like multicopper oxidase with cupredoxin domain
MNGDAKETIAMVTRRCTPRWTKAVLAVALAAAGLAVASTASAAPVSINLCAVTGTATMPGSVGVPIWGFGVPTTPGNCSTATAGLPGPVLEVNVGDVVTVNLGSALPGTHSASFETPAFAVANPSVGVYVFTASRVGAFSYGSPGDSGRQEAMGLYGALVVRPAGETAKFTGGQCATFSGTAYGSVYDRECVLVLGALDPAFNAAPDTFVMHDYLATYWLINGTAYPGTPPIAAPATTRLLLRYVNGGFDNTTMLLLGMHERVLARDAWPLLNTLDADAETIPAGATEEALVTVPSTTPPTTNGFPLYNRQLHVTNGTALNGVTPNPAYSPGGMLTFIVP